MDWMVEWSVVPSQPTTLTNSTFETLPYGNNSIFLYPKYSLGENFRQTTRSASSCCMLMEHLCSFAMGKWILDLTYNQSIFGIRLYTPWNMKKVLPASCWAVASCAPDSSLGCRPIQRTPGAPRSRMGRGFCYHINSICRQHRIWKHTNRSSPIKYGRARIARRRRARPIPN